LSAFMPSFRWVVPLGDCAVETFTKGVSPTESGGGTFSRGNFSRSLKNFRRRRVSQIRPGSQESQQFFALPFDLAGIAGVVKRDLSV
jgi:hypothetical protein